MIEQWLRECRRSEMERKIISLPMLPERFWKKVSFRLVGNDWCWEWIGCRVKSYNLFYPRFTLDGMSLPAHKAMYLITYGAVPKGSEIHHKCRNTICVNPNHLECLTKRENILLSNGASAINSRKTECKRGHQLKGENLIQYKGKRVCRICQKIWQIRFQQSRKLM